MGDTFYDMSWGVVGYDWDNMGGCLRILSKFKVSHSFFWGGKDGTLVLRLESLECPFQQHRTIVNYYYIRQCLKNNSASSTR